MTLFIILSLTAAGIALAALLYELTTGKSQEEKDQDAYIQYLEERVKTLEAMYHRSLNRRDNS